MIVSIIELMDWFVVAISEDGRFGVVIIDIGTTGAITSQSLPVLL